MAEMVYIAGMHRSGSSVLARIVNLLGVGLGLPSTMLPATADNAEGYWEQHPVMIFNGELMRAWGGTWDEPADPPAGWLDGDGAGAWVARARSIIDRYIVLGGGTHGIKDPRLSYTMPVWERARPARAVLLPVRDPRAVVASLMKRDGFSEDKAVDLWLDYTERTLLDVADPVVTTYDSLMQEPTTLARSLCERLDLGVPAGYVLDAVARAVRPGLRHHQPDTAPASSAMARAVAVYDELCTKAL